MNSYDRGSVKKSAEYVRGEEFERKVTDFFKYPKSEDPDPDDTLISLCTSGTAEAEAVARNISYGAVDPDTS